MGYVPATDGVPLKVPLLETVSVLRLPKRVQEYGAVPPAAVRFCKYGVPAVAAGRRAVTTTFPTVRV
jgi:hypothetical protein